jgi:hypothetical protein
LIDGLVVAALHGAGYPPTLPVCPELVGVFWPASQRIRLMLALGLQL